MTNVSDLGFVLHVYLCQSSETPSFARDDFFDGMGSLFNQKKACGFIKPHAFFLFWVDALIGSLHFIDPHPVNFHLGRKLCAGIGTTFVHSQIE